MHSLQQDSVTKKEKNPYKNKELFWQKHKDATIRLEDKEIKKIIIKLTQFKSKGQIDNFIRTLTEDQKKILPPDIISSVFSLIEETTETKLIAYIENVANDILKNQDEDGAWRLEKSTILDRISKLPNEIRNNYDEQTIKESSEDYIPHIWTSSLCLYTLLKWKRYLLQSDKYSSYDTKDKLESAILKGAKWLSNPSTQNNMLYGTLPPYLVKTINTFESSLTILTLIRNENLFKENTLKSFDRSIGEILKLQDKATGAWYSEMVKDNNEWKPFECPDVGATSYALSAIYESNKDLIVENNDIFEACKKALRWIIDNKDKEYYAWGINNKYAWRIDRTCYALQTLIKYSSINSKCFLFDENIITHSANWLQDQFVITKNEKAFAWIDDEESPELTRADSPSVKNTSLIISTLLKCKADPDDPLIIESLHWLLSNIKNQSTPHCVNILCAIIDYIKAKLD